MNDNNFEHANNLYGEGIIVFFLLKIDFDKAHAHGPKWGQGPLIR